MNSTNVLTSKDLQTRPTQLTRLPVQTGPISEESPAAALAEASAPILLRSRTVVAAIDMDCFYAQAEQIRNPRLKGRPVGVQQKMLCITASYEARAFGVQKGDSLAVVRQKCPDIVMCNGEDLTYYQQLSAQVFHLVSEFTRQVERLGLDEVFVDLTGIVDQRLAAGAGSAGAAVTGFVYGDPPEAPGVDAATRACIERLAIGSQVCAEIRQQIHSRLGLTCSAGVSVSKLLAKLVASVHKPHQQTVFVPGPRALRRLLPDATPVQRLPGIGFAATRRLNALGVWTIGDMVSVTDTSDGSQLAALPRGADVAEELEDVEEWSWPADDYREPTAAGGVGVSAAVPTGQWAGPAASLTDLHAAFAPKQLQLFASLCRGIDPSRVQRSADHAKTVSVEDSFWTCPVTSPQALSSAFCTLAAALVRKLRTEEAATGIVLQPQSFRLSVRPKQDSHPADGDPASTAKRIGRQVRIHWPSLKPKAPTSILSGGTCLGRKAAAPCAAGTELSGAERLSPPDEVKATALLETVEHLFRQLWPPDRPICLHIVNLALGNFKEPEGTQGIARFFHRRPLESGTAQPGQRIGQAALAVGPLPTPDAGLDADAFFDDPDDAAPSGLPRPGDGDAGAEGGGPGDGRIDGVGGDRTIPVEGKRNGPTSPPRPASSSPAPCPSPTPDPHPSGGRPLPPPAPGPRTLPPPPRRDIDPAVWAALPPDIRRELQAEAGAPLAPGAPGAGAKRKRSGTRPSPAAPTAQRTLRSLFGPAK